MFSNTEFGIPPRTASPGLEEEQADEFSVDKPIFQPPKIEPANMAKLILAMHAKRAQEKISNPSLRQDIVVSPITVCQQTN